MTLILLSEVGSHWDTQIAFMLWSMWEARNELVFNAREVDLALLGVF